MSSALPNAMGAIQNGLSRNACSRGFDVELDEDEEEEERKSVERDGRSGPAAVRACKFI
jgi:hypothetical protein